jgi:hypothetical protein
MDKRQVVKLAIEGKQAPLYRKTLKFRGGI